MKYLEQMDNAYGGLSSRFYELEKPQPSPEEYDFYKQFLLQSKDSLEPMCGSGRFLIPYLQEGIAIDGFDYSKEMIELLHSKIDITKYQTNVWQDDIEKFEVDKTYDSIIIPCGSFGHIISFTSISRALSQIYNSLSDKGVFVFEVETKNLIRNISDGVYQNSIAIQNNQVIQLRREMFVKEDVVMAKDVYSLLEDDKLKRQETESFQVRLYDNPDSLVKLLEGTGFKTVDIINGSRIEKSQIDYYRLVCTK